MKRGQKVSWFMSGVMAAALVANLLSPALAALASKTIEVFTGVDIYLDDVKLDPRDANGNPVEVFVYNGTTYLPVRAVGEAVGKTVHWEGKTNSVYLGKHNSDRPAVWIQDLDYFTGSGWEAHLSEKDNLGQSRTNVICGGYYGNANNSYKLNGQYTKLTGTFFQNYQDRSDTIHETTLEIYGDGTLLYSATMAGGIEPIDFVVDLTGVLELRVSLDHFGAYNNAHLSDCGLWT